jgi:riboflavin kinase
MRLLIRGEGELTMKDVEWELKPTIWFTLYALLRIGAGARAVKISTTQLAEALGISQQSASRHLRSLENFSMIRREIEKDGSFIHITKRGMDSLTSVYHHLKRELEETAKEAFVFEGIVFSGLGEGAYYVNQEGYRQQVREKLGFEPYPGTLNIRLRTKTDLERKEQLERMPGIEIQSFKTKDRSFGGAKCYQVLVNDEVEGVVVIAERTGYDRSVMELMAPVNLRKRLGLKDGDIVRVSFSSPQ